jgi:serine/threonine kinase 38
MATVFCGQFVHSRQKMSEGVGASPEGSLSSGSVGLSSVQKAQYTKNFLEKHIHRKLAQADNRISRRKQLDEYLAKVDDKQKKEVEKKFILDATRSLRSSRRRISVDDFRTVAVIGRGAFAEIRLVRKKDSKELFAMKIMEKQEMVLRGHVDHVLVERKFMSKVMRMHNRNIGRGLQATPVWLVPQLHWAFQDAKNLYLVMDFLPGGDLVNILMKHDKLNEDQTRFYIAEIAQALNFIHELGYAHRDLKPDNILIEKSGHVRIADFGLCKKIIKSDPKFPGYSSGEEDLVDDEKVVEGGRKHIRVSFQSEVLNFDCRVFRLNLLSEVQIIAHLNLSNQLMVMVLNVIIGLWGAFFLNVF